MAGFMESTMRWAGSEGGKGWVQCVARTSHFYKLQIRQSIQATFDTSAFRDLFSQPKLSERITKLVEYHISYVHEALEFWNVNSQS
jgi:hypothetical protein